MKENSFTMHGFSFDPFREKRLAWQLPSGPSAGPAGTPPSTPPPSGEKMQEWLKKANAKLNEVNSPERYHGGLKQMVEDLHKDGKFIIDDLVEMRRNIVNSLVGVLPDGELAKLKSEFPMDADALLLELQNAGIIKPTELRAAQSSNAAEKARQGSLRGNRETPQSPTPNSSASTSGSQGRTDWAAKAKNDRDELKAEREQDAKDRKEILSKDPDEALEKIRGEMGSLQDQIQALRDEAKGYIQQKSMNRPGIRGRYIRGSKYGQMEQNAYNEYSAKIRDVNEEAALMEKRFNFLNKIHKELTHISFGEWRRDNDAEYDEKISARHEQQQKLAEQMDKDYKKKYGTTDESALRTLKEWDQHRGNTHAGNAWAKEEQWRKEWAAEGITGNRGETSVYYDSTGKDAEYYDSLKGGKGGGSSKHNPYEGYSTFQPYGSDQEKNQYLQKQNKLRQKYIPELTEFVADNLPKVKDDPNYERINKAFNRAKEHWQDDPDRAYGDLAIMRSQIQYMQKRGRFQKLMDAFRASIGEERVKKLPHVSVASPGGRYFSPGEKVHITIPAELLPYSAGKDLTVHYEPFTVMGAEDDSQIDALFDAGILIERSEALLGKYPDGRGRVRGLKIYFTKPGAYKINGKEANVIQGSNQSPSHQSPGSFQRDGTSIA